MKLYLLNIEGAPNFIGGERLSQTMSVVTALCGEQPFRAVIYELDNSALKVLTPQAANSVMQLEHRSLN